jgi:hypothetical protein
MSVESSRLAAAQRTAAPTHGAGRRRRFTRLASWLFIVPLLSLFSFSVVANARTFGKPDYAAAVKQLPAGKPLVLLKAGDKHVLCSVSQGQADALTARWDTGTTTLNVDGSSVPALWVDAPNVHEIRSVLGDADCKLVRQKSIFYLPFSANLS